VANRWPVRDRTKRVGTPPCQLPAEVNSNSARTRPAPVVFLRGPSPWGCARPTFVFIRDAFTLPLQRTAYVPVIGFAISGDAENGREVRFVPRLRGAAALGQIDMDSLSVVQAPGLAFVLPPVRRVNTVSRMNKGIPSAPFGSAALTSAGNGSPSFFTR
jgi:hypothetical protein